MRSISVAGLQSLFAQETEHVWVPAVTLNHAQMPAPLRCVANTVELAYGGNTYMAYPFELQLAADTEDSVPRAKLKIDNVARDIVASVRAVTSSPTVDVEIFRVDGAGTVVREYGPQQFSLLNVHADAQVVEGTLGYDNDFLNEAATHFRFTPGVARGLF